MAKDLAGRGIRVNCIAPGVIATPFHDATPPERMEAMRKEVQLGRIGTPEDCVGPVLFLASPAMSGYVTGQILHINGGQLMPA
jgi:3-oxoacyl-[acyl-carrier protein] reductase